MPSPHILLFPFMAKGHTIPILHLARLLLGHGASVTLLTTPANRPFVCGYLPPSTTINVVDIPFPGNIPGIAPGIESTDRLPDISLWVSFTAATKLMQPQFEQTLGCLLPRVTFMITDDFLGWTLDSAEKYGVPRFVFYSIGSFPLCLGISVARGRFLLEKEGNTDVIKVGDFPWINITREDFDPLFLDPEFVGTRYRDLVLENLESSLRSHGILINTVYELEAAYVDAWNSAIGPRQWCVGPLMDLTEEKSVKPEGCEKPSWIRWLDRMQEQEEKVLYVAFGTQVEISTEQFTEIKTGLEESGVNFLWLVRKNASELDEGFEERVRNRGMVVKQWVDQREILEHQSVQGFLSHCGWSSVMESVCAKVPILAFPVMWDQPVNAKLVAEELRVGLRVETCNRFVKWESLATAAKELMEGETGKEVRKNVAEVGGTAVGAVGEGGSSRRNLRVLVREVHRD